MQLPELAGAVVAASAFVAAVAALWRWSKLGELLRGTRLFLADWFGEPARPGREALPSFPQRMANVEERTAALNHDLRGELTSRLTLLAYSVDRLHEHSLSTNERLAALDARVSDHRLRNDQQQQLLQQAVDRNALRLDEVAQRSHRVRQSDPPGFAVPPSTED